jgi:hypothetical protein
MRTMNLAGWVAVSVMVSACAGEPYVLRDGEFDRQSDYFLRGTVAEETVRVCYAKNKTTPAQVVKLAIDECARFGKVAMFQENTYALCPARTPVAAVFDCKPKGT